MTPPLLKNGFLIAGGKRIRGGVEKIHFTRVHEGVVYMSKKQDDRNGDVKRIMRTKLYKEIEEDLKDQLKMNGTYGKHFEDMVQDYMAMYVTKTLLIEDIQKRGTIVKYNNGGGQEGYKKNESVEMFNKTNAQMMKLLSELGLKANNTFGGGDGEDEL